MTRHLPARSAAGLALVAAALLLAGCGGTPGEAAPTSAPPTVAPPAPTSAETPTPTPTVEADPTCETIIPQEVVDDFADANWSSQSDVFRIGATEVPGGITCTWGDMEVASDNVQMFGWAPIDSDTATQAQSSLVQEGWVREDGDEGIYITENKDTVLAPDDEGYGWTYLFGDGWVKFADTKQGLLLVEWPPAG